MTHPSGSERLVQGNEACALGAMYAGCRFFAGYPITPASEILEILMREMPPKGGVAVQLEDEIASIAACIGASWAGAKAMTATSGPGFSLMQENIGYAAITQTPCVIVDCQRWGPSTGQPTKTSQGDVMQAIWGTHGDHPIIVLTASDVREVFELTVKAFNFSEICRAPAVLLLDEILAHMRENILLPEPGELPVVERKIPAPDDPPTFAGGPMGEFGIGGHLIVTGMAHDERGFPTEGAKAAQMLERITESVMSRANELAIYKSESTDDAEIVIIGYGIVSRVVESSVEILRDAGHKVGWLSLNTLWPFPTAAVQQATRNARAVVVPELNMGQVVRDVKLALAEGGLAPRVIGLNRVDGYLMTPDEVAEGVLRQALVTT
jgi:2-oxoglutarate ferredoxin oxidoreductase subunit alpha